MYYYKLVSGHLYFLFLTACTCLMISCSAFQEENLNSPGIGSVLENATLEELNNLVTGTEASLRIGYAMYIDATGSIGREHYRFSNSEPRYVQDLLGAGSPLPDPTGFYINTPWASRYRSIKNANILIEAAERSTFPTEGQRKGYLAFAKTIQAHQLLLNLNLTHDNGIRVEVSDPENPGPIVSRQTALDAIVVLLDEARSLLESADIEFFFRLTGGFEGFDNPSGFLALTNALSARVALYRERWSEALTFLNGSFLNLSPGNLDEGVYMIFSNANNDILNPLYFPANATGESRVVHPSFASDINAADDRIQKAPLRNEEVVLADLMSDRDVQLYPTSTDRIAIIRNEELVLIYAEAKLQTGTTGDAVSAIDLIRTEHGLDPYSGDTGFNALLDELLHQRRYSLFFEGHRWVDMRRYGRLDQLPVDRPGDKVWDQLPIPFAEQE